MRMKLIRDSAVIDAGESYARRLYEQGKAVPASDEKPKPTKTKRAKRKRCR